MKKFIKCLQCGSKKSFITDDDLINAGLSLSDKKTTTRFCSICCSELYLKRLNKSYLARITYMNGSEDSEWYNLFHDL